MPKQFLQKQNVRWKSRLDIASKCLHLFLITHTTSRRSVMLVNSDASYCCWILMSCFYIEVNQGKSEYFLKKTHGLLPSMLWTKRFSIVILVIYHQWLFHSSKTMIYSMKEIYYASMMSNKTSPAITYFLGAKYTYNSLRLREV